MEYSTVIVSKLRQNASTNIRYIQLQINEIQIYEY